MKVRNDLAFKEKKEQIMQSCFECFAENGLYGTGIASLAKHSNIPKSTLYVYFSSIDELITQSTEYCMSKIEGDFMLKSPKSIDDVEAFIDDVPYWTAERHGKNIDLCIKFTLIQNILRMAKVFALAYLLLELNYINLFLISFFVQIPFGLWQT